MRSSNTVRAYEMRSCQLRLRYATANDARAMGLSVFIRVYPLPTTHYIRRLHMNPYSEAVLYTSSSAREKWDNCANLYSLILSVDALERGYVSQAIPDSQYEPACTRLLSQIKTSIKLVSSSSVTTNTEDPPCVNGLDDFMKLWGLELPLTAHRLQLGIPATLEHLNNSNGNGGTDTGKNVAETTQAFITLMDALKLKLRAKDQLHPLLGEAVSCWNRSGGGGGQQDNGDGQGEKRAKLVGWLITLNKMNVSDEIDDDQARQMLFDVEGAYQAWFRSLQGS
ncbi:unnamed protein product [Sympodiomycopsis kandeliae]